ncbi:MAG: hypothetical protein M3Q55_09200 [Acidobacteriota bacterium]|nr:hypothetical protein [Acidobacteriota bacterium]
MADDDMNMHDYAAKMRAKRGAPLPAPKVPVDLPFSSHWSITDWPTPNPTGEVRSYIEDELRHLRRRLPRTHDGVRARIEGQISALMDVLRRL